MGKIDSFDNFGVEMMGKDEYKTKYKDIVNKCKCKECPSYVAGDAQTGYCFPMGGTSKVITLEKGCVCESCPVWSEYELNHAHYCTRCSQLCQSYKTEGGFGHE